MEKRQIWATSQLPPIRSHNLPDCRKYPNFIATGKLLNVPFKISGIDFVTDCLWKLLQNGKGGLGRLTWTFQTSSKLFKHFPKSLSVSTSEGETSNYITFTHPFTFHVHDDHMMMTIRETTYLMIIDHSHQSNHNSTDNLIFGNIDNVDNIW